MLAISWLRIILSNDRYATLYLKGGEKLRSLITMTTTQCCNLFVSKEEGLMVALLKIQGKRQCT